MSSKSHMCSKPSNTATTTPLSSTAVKENDVIDKADLAEDVLTVREASLLLRVHPDKVTALARRWLIPAGVVGSRWRFSRRALLAHLAKPQQGPIKPTRKLADYPPAKLIARVQKLGGNLVVKEGGLRIEGLSQLSPKLKKAIQANVHQIIKELQ